MSVAISRIYQTLAKQYQANFDAKKKKIRLISLGRFVSFIGIFAAFYYLKSINIFLAFGVSSFLIVAFLILIKRFIETEKQVRFFQRLVETNQDEIKALNRDLSPFDPGNEFTDANHDYSYDLDIFGNGSLFQFLNRTVTNNGKSKLASFLKQSHRTADEIISRQLAIQELSGELNWRQHYLAYGKETNKEQELLASEHTVTHPIHLNSIKTTQNLLKLLPATTVVLTILNFSGIFANPFYFLALLLQWIIFISNSKTVSGYAKIFENQAKRLSSYVKMLEHIESKTFESFYLNQLKKKLLSQGKKASTITSDLQKILNEFDYRQNILVGFVLNSLLLWDLRCLYKLYRWQQNFEDELPQWFDVIAEIDALISLANCNYNHPEWTTPEVLDTGFRLNATNMGHPLIDRSKCIRNSFQIGNKLQIAIITGANMAGKSTFLRTVGVNLTLAGNGCKVCAESFEFSPIRVFTNMRTSDNLMNDESYFYAELLRLQSMLKLLRNGENLFVIIDEMLKGTNSTDKLNGSKEMINQLITLKSYGIVATHDLELTKLASRYPDEIRNQCFEVILHDDELKFDYRLSEGVTRTMNATFLMKKMGIIPND